MPRTKAGQQKPLRRDAQRNRDLLLAAARYVFKERGVDVALDEIARRADVSIGTLYNHFSSRQALVEAVFADRFEASHGFAEEALAMDDGWAGFVYFLERTCELQALDLGLNDVVSRRVPAAAPAKEAATYGYDLMQRIVRRAQTVGQLRGDVTLEDMAFVVWGHARTVESTSTAAPRAWRRHLALMLDGLRASAAHPLPEPPLRPTQVRRAMRDTC